MITGFALTFALAAMIAPRKLQSLGAAVQAVAATASSARSTVNVVATGRIRLEVSGTARGPAIAWLGELEDARWVCVRNAPTKTMSVNSEQAIFLFIGMLQPNWL